MCPLGASAPDTFPTEPQALPLLHQSLLLYCDCLCEHPPTLSCFLGLSASHMLECDPLEKPGGDVCSGLCSSPAPRTVPGTGEPCAE